MKRLLLCVSFVAAIYGRQLITVQNAFVQNGRYLVKCNGERRDEGLLNYGGVVGWRDVAMGSMPMGFAMWSLENINDRNICQVCRDLYNLLDATPGTILASGRGEVTAVTIEQAVNATVVRRIPCPHAHGIQEAGAADE